MLLSDILCLIDKYETFCLEFIYEGDVFLGQNYITEEIINDKFLNKKVKVTGLRAGRRSQGLIITIEVD